MTAIKRKDLEDFPRGKQVNAQKIKFDSDSEGEGEQPPAKKAKLPTSKPSKKNVKSKKTSEVSPWDEPENDANPIKQAHFNINKVFGADLLLINLIVRCVELKRQRK
jgi:hypothetical protein